MADVYTWDEFDRQMLQVLTGRDAPFNGAAMTYTATTPGSDTLTYDRLLESFKEVEKLLDRPAGPQPLRGRKPLPTWEIGGVAPGLDWGGLNVVESRIADMPMPVKLHKKRRSQSWAYHRRIQKKWTKRYGTTRQAYAYLFHNTVVVPPGMVAKLKEQAHAY